MSIEMQQYQNDIYGTISIPEMNWLALSVSKH